MVSGVTIVLNWPADDGEIGYRILEVVELWLSTRIVSLRIRLTAQVRLSHSNTGLDILSSDRVSFHPDFTHWLPQTLVLYFSSHPPVNEKYTKIFAWNCALHSASDVVFDCCAHANIGGGGEEGGNARRLQPRYYIDYQTTEHRGSGLQSELSVNFTWECPINRDLCNDFSKYPPMRQYFNEVAVPQTMSDNKRDFGTLLIYFLAMTSQELRWRVLQEKAPDMPQYTGQPELQQTSSYSVDVSYHPTNGHPDNLSPNSSHLSVHSGDVGNLVSRTQNQQTTQQVTTLTKVVREVHHVGPDGQPVDYVGVPYSGVLPTSTAPTSYVHPQFSNYELLGGQEHYPPMDPARHYPEPYHPSYQDYEQYPYTNPPYAGAFPAYGETVNYVERPPTPPSPSEQSESPSLQPALQHDYLRKNAPFPQPGYDELDSTLVPPRQDHYRITPSPGGPGDRYDQIAHPWSIDDSGEPSQLPHGEEPKLVYGYAPPSPYGTVPAAYGSNGTDPRVYEENTPSSRALFEDGEELRKHLSLHALIPSPSVDEEQRGMRWRDPNLTEVIGFLNNPNNVIKANAAAYLQHLCYMDDPNRQDHWVGFLH
uniref:Uncharacterized protein n=1 Tax=Timema cristinae TaxID=61476 RepID=A0A7R9CAG5_TIMCR|nr:unnamed protein product [Timema cristinae]